MNTPFKMKGFSGFGNSPMKQDKAKLTKQTTKQTTKLTDREIRIANAKEFNAYAVEKGMKPPQPGDNATDKEVMDYRNFYKNKDNVNMLNKEQKKYFKNKKK